MCVTKDDPPKIHAHKLNSHENRNAVDVYSNFTYIEDEHTIIQINNLGIQRTKKCDIVKELKKREKKQIDPFKST